MLDCISVTVFHLDTNRPLALYALRDEFEANSLVHCLDQFWEKLVAAGLVSGDLRYFFRHDAVEWEIIFPRFKENRPSVA